MRADNIAYVDYRDMCESRHMLTAKRYPLPKAFSHRERVKEGHGDREKFSREESVPESLGCASGVHPGEGDTNSGMTFAEGGVIHTETVTLIRIALVSIMTCEQFTHKLRCLKNIIIYVKNLIFFV